MRVLLDTHTVLWWHADAHRLSGEAERVIATADALLVSPLSCWEISSLARQGRIVLDRDPRAWIDKLVHEPRVDLAPVTWQAAVWAGQLERDRFRGDPIDRLICGAAYDQRVPLVTKDDRLHAFARRTREIDVIW